MKSFDTLVPRARFWLPFHAAGRAGRLALRQSDCRQFPQSSSLHPGSGNFEKNVFIILEINLVIKLLGQARARKNTYSLFWVPLGSIRSFQGPFLSLISSFAHCFQEKILIFKNSGKSEFPSFFLRKQWFRCIQLLVGVDDARCPGIMKKFPNYEIFVNYGGKSNLWKFVDFFINYGNEVLLDHPRQFRRHLHLIPQVMEILLMGIFVMEGTYFTVSENLWDITMDHRIGVATQRCTDTRMGKCNFREIVKNENVRILEHFVIFSNSDQI